MICALLSSTPCPTAVERELVVMNDEFGTLSSSWPCCAGFWVLAVHALITGDESGRRRFLPEIGACGTGRDGQQERACARTT